MQHCLITAGHYAGTVAELLAPPSDRGASVRYSDGSIGIIPLAWISASPDLSASPSASPETPAPEGLAELAEMTSGNRLAEMTSGTSGNSPRIWQSVYEYPSHGSRYYRYCWGRGRAVLGWQHLGRADDEVVQTLAAAVKEAIAGGASVEEVQRQIKTPPR